MLSNYIKTAWSVLMRRPLYTFITLFGITFTLTILIVTTSLIDHLVGDHYPEVNRSKSLYVQSIKLMDSTGNSSTTSPMSAAFINTYISGLPEAEAVGITSVSELSNVIIEENTFVVDTKYTDSNFWKITAFLFIEGHPFTDQQIKSASQVAIITKDLADQHFGGGPAINKTITINNQVCHVIGVVKPAPITRPISAASVYLPYSIDSPRINQSLLTGKYSALILGKNNNAIQSIKGQFNNALSRVDLPQVSGEFLAYSIEAQPKTFIESLVSDMPVVGNSSGTTLLLLTILIALAFMGLPAINLINLNSGRIMERSSEIGIRKAFGARISVLIWQFVIENIFISCVGGTIALCLSLVILSTINASEWIPNATLSINFSVFTIAVLASIVFGLLSGVLPAIRMAKIPISEALLK